MNKNKLLNHFILGWRHFFVRGVGLLSDSFVGIFEEVTNLNKLATIVLLLPIFSFTFIYCEIVINLFYCKAIGLLYFKATREEYNHEFEPPIV